MIKLSTHTTYFILLAVTFFLSIASKEFYSRGEAREAVVAQAMYNSGNYILPESYNGAVPSKPPLLHWAINGVGEITGGIYEWTCRAPSAVTAIIFAALFFLFLKQLYGSNQALITVAVLSTTFEWYRAATTARVDMVFSASLAGALLLWFSWIQHHNKSYLIFSILILTASALAKGPVAFILFGSITSLFLFYRTRSLPLMLGKILPLIIIAFCLSSLWYLSAWYSHEDRFLAKFYYENISRFTSTMDDEPHKHNIFYLYGMFFVGFLPWTLLAVFEFRKKTKLNLQDPIIQFSIINIIIIVLFFSIPSSKRGVYLLPAYPFLSIIIATLISNKERWIKVAFALCACLMIGDGIIAPRIANTLSYKSFAEETRDVVSSQPVLYSYEDEFYGFSFYLNKPFRSINQIEDINDGYVYLFEANLDKFQNFMKGKKLSVVLRSSKNIVKKNNHVVLVKVSQL